MIKNTQLKEDGWVNLIAGIGKSNSDKTEHNEFGSYQIFDDETLSLIYDGEGLGAAIIDTYANDMTRTGWIIENDKDQKIEKEQNRLKIEQVFNKALKYARLYRGSIIVMVTDRGKLEDKLSSNINKIIGLKVFSAARIELQSSDFVTDPNSEYFEDVEYFHVRLRNGQLQNVHKSRCIVFYGEMSSDSGNLDFQYRYWGFSTIQRIWDRLSNYAMTEKGVANLMLEFCVGKYKLTGLASILAQNTTEAFKKIYNRIDIINLSKSSINAVLLDADKEDYTRDSVNVSGLSDLIDRSMMNLSSVCGIPVTKLFGRSPAGMNATGDSDIRDYYDKIDVKRKNILQSEIQKVIDIISGYVYPGTSEKYTITFNSLWEPTQKEQAEIENLQANTDEKYIANMVLDPEEVRTQRFPELLTHSLPVVEEEEIEEVKK